MNTRTLSINIPGEPVAKGRARSARMQNGRTIHYTPQKTRTWEGIARSLAMDAIGDQPIMTGPLHVHVTIALAIPQSWPNWKRGLALDCNVYPTTKPDADNVVKAVKDALNGVIWTDDAQVVSMEIRKLYSANPRVHVYVQEWAGLTAQQKTRPRG